MNLPKSVAVLGLGVSGCAIVEILLRRGVKVIAADEKQSLDEFSQSECIKRLAEQGAQLVLGANAFKQLLDLRPQVAILSPGISVLRKEIAALEEAGTELIGEVEFSYRLLTEEFGREKICLVAITGTKGKTTTAHLTANMLQASGLTTILAGNVGVPLAKFVDQLPKEGDFPIRVVMEVSSFQLATCKTFRPDIAAFTTLFVDHLDWHITADHYRRSKAKIFANQKGDDWAVLNADNAGVRWMAQFVKGKILWCGKEVSLSCPYCTHWVSDDGEIVWAALGKEKFPVARLSEFLLRGEHNIQNLRVAVGAALLAGAYPDVIADVVRNFRGVPHRLELVGEVRGVRFVNDSAATTPDAAAAGVRSFETPVILISGGLDKGGDWSEFRKALKANVKALVAMGEFANSLVEMAKEAGVKFAKAKTMKEAVQIAFEFATPGDIVLLSLGCASFDMFANYAHRGEEFKKAVKELENTG